MTNSKLGTTKSRTVRHDQVDSRRSSGASDSIGVTKGRERMGYGPLSRVMLVLLAALMAVPANAQLGADETPEWLRRRLGIKGSFRRDNVAMKRLVAPISDSIRESVVQVLCGGEPVALGTIVATDGYVVTKRSELTAGDPIRLKLFDKRLIPGRLAGMSEENDLALIKIDSQEKFEAVKFLDKTPEPGSFLISSGRAGNTIGFGVVGSGRIGVKPQGRLGVNLRASEVRGATVFKVQPGSGAAIAGIERGDQIIAINGKEQNDRFQVVNTLSKMYPGAIVQLTIVRDQSTIEMSARMRDLRVLQESENDARVNGPRNDRLSGFDDVIQHDTVLNPHECGGPVLDTLGNVVGLNIARAGRVVSYALPASVMMNETVKMLNEARRQATGP